MLSERGDMAILLVEQYFDFARALADQYLILRGARWSSAAPAPKWMRRSCAAIWWHETAGPDALAERLGRPATARL